MNAPRIEEVPLAALRADDRVQMRAEIDMELVEAYAQDLQRGAVFPPALAFSDGKTNWLAAGFHRRLAHRWAGLPTMLCEIREGTFRDALLFAAGDNAVHGLRRTNADKRKAVAALLNDREWRQWSDRELARRSNTSDALVREMRRELFGDQPGQTRIVTAARGGAVYSMTCPAAARERKSVDPDEQRAQHILEAAELLGEAGEVLRRYRSELGKELRAIEAAQAAVLSAGKGEAGAPSRPGARSAAR